MTPETRLKIERIAATIHMLAGLIWCVGGASSFIINIWGIANGGRWLATTVAVAVATHAIAGILNMYRS